MSEPVMSRAKGDGVEIQLATWEGEGRTILCVHGLTANCRCWDVIANALAPKHRVIALDLRGRGLSGKPPSGYSEEQHLRDIHHLLKDMGLEKAVLMGHSLGGYISMCLAAEHPEQVEGLILMDAGGDLSQDHWDRVAAAIRPSLERLEKIFPSLDDYIEAMKQVPVFQPWSHAIETYFRYDLEDVENGMRSRIRLAHIQEEVKNKRQTGAAPFYSKISCPVLILRAPEGILVEDDILLPQGAVNRMLKDIPDARIVNVKGTNHFSILFQPNEERDQSILTFLSQ
jgi:pimeloyl-ACP methyl ester carboxylesterase